MSGCIAVIAPAVSRNGSLEAQLAAAKARREEPIVVPLNCGVSVGEMRARRGLRANWPCRRSRRSLHNLALHGVEMAGAPVDIAGLARRDGDPPLAHAEPALPSKVAKLHDSAPETLKSRKRLSTSHVWPDETEARRSHVIASRETAAERRARWASLLPRFARNDGVPQRADLGVHACPEMVPQQLENIEFAPGNGTAPDASGAQCLAHGGAAETVGLRDAERRKGLRRLSHGLRARGGSDAWKRQFLAPNRLKTKARGQT